MKKRLIIARGLPGSGKSTAVAEFRNKTAERLGVSHLWSSRVCSTDSYWLRPDGHYDFNMRRIGEAHAWNKERAERYMAEEILTSSDTVIIDNTNITWKEIKPYVLLAKKYGYEVEVLEPDTSWRYDPIACVGKTAHGVPLETIKNMHSKWEPTSSIKGKIEEVLSA